MAALTPLITHIGLATLGTGFKRQELVETVKTIIEMANTIASKEGNMLGGELVNRYCNDRRIFS